MGLGDTQREFETFKKGVVESIMDFFPVVGKTKTLRIKKVWVDDNLDVNDFDSQQTAKLNGRSWSVPVYVSAELIDNNTKEIIDSKPRLLIAKLPKITPRLSYIVDGNEYQILNQLRLKPGVYTRKQENGVLQSFFNLSKGMNFKMNMAPDSGKFSLQFGTTNIKLLPVLKAMGISDKQFIDNFGKDIYQANMTVKSEQELAKMYHVIYNEKSESTEQAIEGIKGYFSETKLDPETTSLTIGKRYGSVNSNLLLDAANKILRVNRGEDKPDDRDALQFKSLQTAPDLVKIRIEKNRPKILYRLRPRVDLKDTVDSILYDNKIKSAIDGLFKTSDLSAYPTQLNPVDMISGFTKLTIKGEGGIQDANAIPMSSRNVHPSQFGFIDASHTPESSEIGTVSHLAVGATKQGGEFVTSVFNIKSGKEEKISSLEFSKSNVALPREYDKTKSGWKARSSSVKALRDGQIITIPSSEVDYLIMSPQDMFDIAVNLIPFVSNTSGARVMMGAKMQEQALSLVNREKPLVSAGTDSGISFDSLIGKVTTVESPVSGVVSKVTDKSIQIKTKDGKKQEVQIYHNFPLNQHAMLTSTPTVNVGDKVSIGQIVADSNFNKDGDLAIGTNLRTAYINYKGYNFEDGTVISESASKKLTSYHLHKKSVDISRNGVLSKRKFRAYFPNELSAQMASKLDENGIIQEGQEVGYGDVLVAYMDRKELSPEDIALGKISKALAKPYKNSCLIWSGSDKGIVDKTVQLTDRVEVYVKTEEQAKVGDKVAGRFGNKATITSILPDAEMPHTSDGNSVDIILNPNSIVSRINPGQVMEAVASKVAEKEGHTYLVKSFSGENMAERIKKDMLAAGVTDKEEVIDPATGKSIGKVLVGKQYILKLDHPARKKLSARDFGTYTTDMTPAKGEKETGQSFDPLTFYSAIAHGAKANLRDVYAYKGEKNEEFWRAIQTGEPLPPPKTPFVFNKLVAMMNGMGINVDKEGSNLKLLPMGENEVKSMSNGEIKNPKFVISKNLQEEKGGLFDINITGGMNGEKFSHISLPEEIPNPTFESAIIALVPGLSQTIFDRIIEGSLYVNKDGKFVEENTGITGGKAIRALLEKIDVNAEIQAAKEKARSATGTALNSLNKRIRYLLALKENGLDPTVYMQKSVPVLPPRYRPIYPMQDGSLMASGTNYLYRDLMLLSQQLGGIGDLPDSEKKDLRADTYKAVKSLYGFGNSTTNPQYNGIFVDLRGTDRNKEGFFQKKVFRKRQDLSARSVISPDPNLHVDEVGVPEKILWKIYKPFIVRELGRLGYTPLQAQEEIEKESQAASRALDIAIKQRPVLLNRAPSLHKFSLMAFMPKRVQGDAIKIPNLVTKGFSADFDGNCCSGNTLLTLRLCAKLWSKEAKAMRATGDTRLLVKGDDFVIVAAKIKDIPKGSFVGKDKNGADVYDLPAGISVLTTSLDGLGPRYCEATRMTIENGCRVVSVTTKSSKFNVKVSDNESMAVYDHLYGTIIKAKPERSIGALVPYVSCYPIPEGIDSDVSVGWMIGAFCGDGFIMGGLNRIGFAKLSADCRRKFEDGMSSIFNTEKSGTYYGHKGIDKFGESAKDHYNDVRDMRIFNDCYAEGDQVDTEGRAALRKKLPGLKWTRKLAIGVLSGLIDTDGSIKKVKAKDKAKEQFQVQYSTSSPYLKDGVMDVCRMLGIRSSYSTVKPSAGRPQKHDAYVISISSVDFLPISKELTIQNKCYVSIIDEFFGKESKDDRDIVPVPVDVFDYTRDAKLWENKSTLSTMRTMKSKGGAYPSASRSLAEKVCSEVKRMSPGLEWVEKWDKIINDNKTKWDRIASVEEIETETVYDLVVPETKVFAVNDGLIIYDTMSITVPVSQEAVSEAMGMMPSKNLLSTSKTLMTAPSQESQLGLYLYTLEGQKTDKTYSSEAEVLKDLEGGAVKYDDVIAVKGKKTTPGRVKINSIIPPNLRNSDVILDGKATKKILTSIARNDPKNAPAVIDEFKRIGHDTSYSSGFSVGIDDLIVNLEERNRAFQTAISAADKRAKKLGTEEEKTQAIVEEISKVDDKLINAARKDLPKNRNAFFEMVTSGARGSWDQAKQILYAPVLVNDAEGKTIPYPIKHSYAEGLGVDEYLESLYGARKGMIDRQKGTAGPGEWTKTLMASTIDNVVSVADCGTQRGVEMRADDPESLGRYVARSVGPLRRNEIYDDQASASMQRSKTKMILLRSPLTCQAMHGTCQKCAGLNENGDKQEIGTNIGAISGQSLTEPATQLVLKCQDKHSIVFIKDPAGNIGCYTHEEAYGLVNVCEYEFGNVSQKFILGTGYEVMDSGGWTQIKSISRHMPEVPMVFVKSACGYAQTVQEDHPLFVTNGLWACRSCKSKNYKHAGSGRDFRKLQCVSCGTTVKLSIEKFNEIRDRVKIASDLDETDFIEINANVPWGDKEIIPEIPDGYVAGFFCAEGSYHTCKSQRKHPICGHELTGLVISQKEGELRDVISEKIDAMGLVYSWDDINMTIYNKEEAHKFYRTFGAICDKKKLPPNFIHYPKEWLSDFISGLVDGDGCAKSDDDGTRKIVLVSTSRAMLSQVQLILANFNVPSSVHNRTIFDSDGVKRKACYYLYFPVFETTKNILKSSVKVQSIGSQKRTTGDKWLNNKECVSQVRLVKKVQYKGFVYDIETESHGYLVGGMRTHNSFHTGGVSSAKGGVTDSFTAIQQLINTPKIMPGKATLAETAGTISRIEASPTGGTNIWIKDLKHFVPRENEIKVKANQKISKGDPLSAGIQHPSEIVNLKGMDAARQYMTDSLFDIYQKGGSPVSKRHFETVVRSVTNTTQILDPKDNTEFVEGDIAPYDTVEALNREKPAGDKIIHQPVIKGAVMKPFSRRDWLSQLAYRNLKDAVQLGAAQGWKSDIKGYNPIPAYAAGSFTIDKDPETNIPSY